MLDTSTTMLAGLPAATLQAWLTEAQLALHQLSTGAKVATASYTQGDGAKSVTYTQADAGRLASWIASLQAQLGIGRQGRRPARFVFR